jgi:hypothetical protein
MARCITSGSVRLASVGATKGQQLPDAAQFPKNSRLRRQQQFPAVRAQAYGQPNGQMNLMTILILLFLLTSGTEPDANIQSRFWCAYRVVIIVVFCKNFPALGGQNEKRGGNSRWLPASARPPGDADANIRAMKNLHLKSECTKENG